jgi:hypothetical protein
MTSAKELFIVVVIVFLGMSLTSAFQDDTPIDTEIKERSQQEKEAVLNQLAEGKILYLKIDEYIRNNPSIPLGAWAWVGYEPRMVETWMGADTNVNTSTYIITSHSLNGDLLLLDKMTET